MIQTVVLEMPEEAIANPWPKRERRCRLCAFGVIRFSGCASPEPILPAKLFHTSDRRKRHYLIGREIAKAVTA